VIESGVTTLAISRAKINLTLEILGCRPDGFHNISTVFQAIELSDKLTFDWDTDHVSLSCNNSEVPNDESNLIIKAIRVLEKHLGFPLKLKVALEKEIPMGAGLGGGSSNAAAVLLELGRKFSIPLEKLLELATSLGADVPFLLQGGTALATGKGEMLESLPALPTLPLVIVKPSFSISTALAYSKISKYSSGEKTEKLVSLLKERKFDRIFDCLTNDFEDALFPIYSELPKLKQELLSHGALAAQMSGSGSAFFAIARDANHANQLAETASRFGKTWITQTS